MSTSLIDCLELVYSYIEKSIGNQ